MKTITKIESCIDSAGEFGWWDEEADTFYSLESDEAVADFVKRKDFRKELVNGINSHLRCLVETIRGDLEDIWKRLDRIEGK